MLEGKGKRNSEKAHPVLAHRIGEALGAPRARDEADLDLREPEARGTRRQDHVTLFFVEEGISEKKPTGSFGEFSAS